MVRIHASEPKICVKAIGAFCAGGAFAFGEEAVNHGSPPKADLRESMPRNHSTPPMVSVSLVVYGGELTIENS